MMSTTLNLFHRKIANAVIELAISICHLNMVANVLIDTLVGAKGTVGTSHADSAVFNVFVSAAMIVLEHTLIMMTTK